MSRAELSRNRGNGELTMELTESYWPADTSEDLVELTVGDLLRRAAAEVPERVALVDGVDAPSARRRWTYAELLAESERIARALLQRFAPGDSVALYSANCAEWVLLAYGANLAGILIVPVNPAYKADELAAILGQSRAAGIFYQPEFRANNLTGIVEIVRERIDHLRETIPLSELETFAGEGSADTALPDITPTDLLHVQYTSGTAGRPKGVLLHHRGTLNTTRFVADRAGFPEGGVWVNAMPVFHIGGAAVTRFGCLSRQGTYVLAPGFDAGGMLELLESERGNVTLVVPTMIHAMLEHPDFKRRDLSSVRTILSGAATVPSLLVRRVKSELDCDFSILFGSTEVNGVVTQTRLDDSVEDQSETLGRALPHAEIKMADPISADVVPIGEPGEICVRGYQIMAGYHNMPEETSQTIRDGWVHTGDLGVMDERGYIRIAGRLKDMIIRGGMNISPREIEETILELPTVGQVSVIGQPDEKWGEVIAAVVIPHDPAEPPTPDALNEHCRSRLATHKSPRYWYFVDAFPLTPSGKVQKFELQSWIKEGRIQAAEWTPPSARS